MESVFAAVSKYYQVDRSLFSARGDGHIARAAAAWLSRRLTNATLRELSVVLNLGRPESVSNLIRRMEQHLARNSQMKRDLAKLELRLATKTKNKA
jgi:chromosomal replication initiation ATPase DnaA